MPKNLDEVLKQYDSLKRSPPTIPEELEKILIPNEDAIDHMTDYVHTGSFEWYDEKLGRSIECNRSANFKVALSKDSYQFDFSTWPRKLKFNFLPKSAVASAYPQLLYAKRLFFHFHPKDTSDTIELLQRFQNDIVGDVVLPLKSESTVKTFMCVFFPHRRILMGVIPDDQRIFTIQMEFIWQMLREERVCILTCFD